MALIFISHSSQDKAYAKKLEAHLKDKGFEVWIDYQDIRTGKDLDKEVKKGVRKCAALVVINTPAATASHWVQEEINYAEKKKKRIIPLWLEGDVPPRLFRILNYDVKNGSMPDDKVFKDIWEKIIRRKRFFYFAAGFILPALFTLFLWVFLPSLRPTLQPFTSPLLQGRTLKDVAAANGHVWFATDQGLLHYDESTQVMDAIENSGSVETLAVNQTGDEVWLIHSNGKQVGHYILSSEPASIEWLTPELDTPTRIESIHSIQVGKDGTIWLSDYDSGIIFQLINGSWSMLEGSDERFVRVDKLFLNDTNIIPTLWVVGWSAEPEYSGDPIVYRWQENSWTRITVDEICNETACVLQSVASENRETAYIAHSEGITMMVEDGTRGLDFQICTERDADLLNDTFVTGILSIEDKAVWLLTLGELTRLELPKTPTADCARLHWQAWVDSAFLNEDSYASYRMALDYNSDCGTSIIWVIRLDTGSIRRLEWPK